MSALAYNGTRVEKRTMEGYLCDVAHIFSKMGSKDPRLDVHINFHLSRKLHIYTQVDAHPESVCPVTTAPLHGCWWNLHDGDAHQQAISDLIYLGFLFLF